MIKYQNQDQELTIVNYEDRGSRASTVALWLTDKIDRQNGQTARRFSRGQNENFGQK
jgi:hypothetical protein